MKTSTLSHLLLALLLPNVMSEQLIRKRTALAVQDTTIEVFFGRLVEEYLTPEESFSYSYSYSFSLPPYRLHTDSYSYSFSYSYSLSLPYYPSVMVSEAPSAVPGPMVTAVPSEATSLDTSKPSMSMSPSNRPSSRRLPSKSPTMLPTMLPTAVPTKKESEEPSYSLMNVTVLPSATPSIPLTASPSAQPSASPFSPSTSPSLRYSVTNTPFVDTSSNDSAPPTNNAEMEVDVEKVNINNTSPNTTSDSQGGSSSRASPVSGAFFLVPVTGLLAGAFIAGISWRAVDRRNNGLMQYTNLDGDSHSSFSLEE